LVLLAELADLDRWDFVDQIGEPVSRPWARLVPAPPRGRGVGRARVSPRRRAADVVGAVAPRLDQLAGCGDRLVLLSAFASVMLPGPADVTAAPYLAAARDRCCR